MAYTKLETHVQDALARLTSAFAQAPNARAIVTVFAQAAQDTEDAIWGVAQNQLRKGATLAGYALDVLGRVVGQTRGGLDDATYYALLLGQIGQNSSDATVAAVQAVAAQIFEASCVFLATPNAPVDNPVHAPGAIQLGLGGAQAEPALYGRLLGILKATRGAGITLANVVVFDATAALAPDGPQPWVAGFSDLNGQGGGKLADLISSTN